MRWFGYATAIAVSIAGAATLVAQGSGPGQTPAPVSPQVEVSQHPPSDFSGVWIYNADESINIATGKPELAPKSATQRSGGSRGATPSARSGRDGGGGSGSPRGGSGGGYSRAPDLGPSPEMLHAARDLMRDLLEIPQSLKIDVTPSSVTIVDDLNRSRTYATDGSRGHYRLGGSQFDARSQWRDSQLHQDIDGDFGFKMTDVFFLSADAKRLFVVLRVLGIPKNQPQIGADRVYDREDAR